MRILHLDAGREMRGGQWQAWYLMRTQAQAGHAVRLLARGPLAAAARNEGIETEMLSLSTVRRRSAESEIVHCHDARSHGYAAVSARVPFVVARRVAFPIRTGWLSRWKYHRASHYIAVSQFAAAELTRAGVDPARVTVIPDAVPLPDGVSDRSGAVVAPDIDDPRKGRALLQEAAQRAGVEVLWSRNLTGDLPTARLFVYLSESEGLGSAALLAMAYGVPVIASNVGGLPEVVQEVLVENRAADVAQAILKVLGSEQTASRLAREGRQRVERFHTFPILGERTEAVYRKVLAC